MFRIPYELSKGSIIAGSGDSAFDGPYIMKLTASGSLLWNKCHMKYQYKAVAFSFLICLKCDGVNPVICLNWADK